MSFFTSLGDFTEGISVTVGNTTYNDVFTTFGNVIGGAAVPIGMIADALTKDTNINIDDMNINYWFDSDGIDISSIDF